MNPPRARMPSRPDPRADEPVTALAVRTGSLTDPPWWADMIRDELRDLRLRIGAVEDQVDGLGELAAILERLRVIEGVVARLDLDVAAIKARHTEGTVKAEKWGGRAWDATKTVVAALVILLLGSALQRSSCIPPAPPPPAPAVERKP